MKTRSLLLIVPFIPLLAILSVFFLAAGPVQAAPAACVAGPHSGTITADETWCLTDSPHTLSTDVVVAQGVTLTIEPGVTVMSNSGQSAELKVQGHLEAVGAPTQPITFTRAVGATYWPGLVFDGSAGQGGGNLQHAVVEHGNGTLSVGYNPVNILALNVTTDTLVIEDSRIQNGQRGIRIIQSQVAISNTLFTGFNSATYAPFQVEGSNTVLTLHNNTFSGNYYNRVLLMAEAMTAHGFTLTAQADLEGYWLQGDLTIPAGYTLGIEPGVTVMGNTTSEIKILGQLQAIGTPTQPITFTSDNTYWVGLVFDGSTGQGGGTLRHTVVERGGGSSTLGYNYANIQAVNVTSNTLAIEDSRIQNGTRGLYIRDSQVVVSNTLFTGFNSTGYFPVQVYGGSSMITLTNNTFSGSANNQVLLDAGAMMGHDTTLVPQTGLDGYALNADFTVPSGITLTLAPGVTIIGWSDLELKVQGHLEAVGTPAQPITFTTSVANWTGLIFDGSAGQGSGHLSYAVVEHGRGTNSLSYGMWFNILAYHTGSNVILIENSRLQNGQSGLVAVNSQAVTVRNTLFTGLLTNGAYVGDGAQVTFQNVVFMDNAGLELNGVQVAANGQATLLHSTIARNSVKGLYVKAGGTATLTNSILAENGTGVYAEAGSNVTLLQTLWDRNTTPIIGTVNETGHIDGPAGFASDGYHLTRFSMAIERGVAAGVADDIDGGPRPDPADTLPDLGADEHPFNPETDLIAENLAFEPLGVITYDSFTDQMSFDIWQRYLLRFYHGTAVPEPLDVLVTDFLPDGMALDSEVHSPPMSFNDNGEALTWQPYDPVGVGDSLEMWVNAVGRPQPDEAMVNRATFSAGEYYFDLVTETTAPFFPPMITSIGNGEYCYLNDVVNVSGAAMGNTLVHIFENGIEVMTTTADAQGVFTSTYQSLHWNEPITVTAQSCLLSNPAACSEESIAAHLLPAESFWDPQRSLWDATPVSGPLAGQHILLHFRDRATGDFATDGWAIPGGVGSSWNTELRIYVCEDNVQPRVQGGGEWHTGHLEGDYWVYEIESAHHVTICDQDYLRCTEGDVLVDPDGYVFDVTKGFDLANPTLNIVQGVTVTCMISQPQYGGWVPWPAHLYENQVNPQVTDEDGYFAFFTPPGNYYLQVDAPAGYQSWRSPVIEVVNEIVHVNVPLTPSNAPPHYRVTLLPDGPSLPALTVDPGSIVEWLVPWDNMTLPEELLALVENPALHLLSALDPLSNTLGFDGGMLAPGAIYRRQFTTPGIYPYDDGLGHTGQIVVTGSFEIFLPMVLRNP